MDELAAKLSAMTMVISLTGVSLLLVLILIGVELGKIRGALEKRNSLEERKLRYEQEEAPPQVRWVPPPQLRRVPNSEDKE